MRLRPGSRVGHFEILGDIGAGAMGEVYRARDTELGRDVALKVLPASVAGDVERLARLRREAQMIAALNHPNIAQIHAVQDDALVLELVDGVTLADRIAQRPLRKDDALAIAQQMAAALEAAHSAGVVHRDFKPATSRSRTMARSKSWISDWRNRPRRPSWRHDAEDRQVPTRQRCWPGQRRRPERDSRLGPRIAPQSRPSAE